MNYKYYCQACNFHTNLKSDYLRHTKTTKHIKLTTSGIEENQCDGPNGTNDVEVSSGNLFCCVYCKKEFTRKSSMKRHIKYTCTQSNDEDMKELVRLLNERDCSNSKKLVKMKSQIDRLTRKLQLTNMSNNNNVLHGNINNNNNVSLLAYENTTHKFLHEKDYIRSIKDCNYCVKTFIEKVHFNTAHPENMNVYISSIKANHIMVYKNNRWNIVDRNIQLENMYMDNEMQLESWYMEYKDKYPEIIQSFKRYLHNKEEDELMNRVKKEIMFMLYNKRDIVTENYEKMKRNQEYKMLLEAENIINE